jgi:thiosulfate reductase cytochrome b subunit
MTGTMWVLAAVIVLLPFVLMLLFNGRNRADARGRRIDAAWRQRRQEI